MDAPPLLEVSGLRVCFPVKSHPFARKHQRVQAVNGVTFSLAEGETLGVVGESGCGKTTLGKAVVRLLTPTSGEIRFEEEDLARLRGSRLRAKRRHLQMIFQDPYGSLDPRMTVAEILGEGLKIHRLAPNRRERQERIEILLRAVGLEPSHAFRYPREFSGGQRQRISIARALAVDPRLVVCDEPVSALDVSVQAQVINLLHDLQEERRMAYLFIAHDLAVVEHISHRVLVMYLGRVVETGPAKAVCGSPKHPYTQALLSAVPSLDPSTKRKRLILPGELPSPIHPPKGCPFHPRCPVAEPRCEVEVPALEGIGEGRAVACHRVK